MFSISDFYFLFKLISLDFVLNLLPVVLNTFLFILFKLIYVYDAGYLNRSLLLLILRFLDFGLFAIDLLDDLTLIKDFLDNLIVDNEPLDFDYFDCLLRLLVLDSHIYNLIMVFSFFLSFLQYLTNILASEFRYYFVLQSSNIKISF